MLQTPGVKRRPDGPPGSYADLTYVVVFASAFVLLEPFEAFWTTFDFGE